MRSAARRSLRQGMLYIGCYDNNLYALNSGDGKFQWKYPTEGGVVSRPALYEGNIIFGSQDKRLHVDQRARRQDGLDVLHGRSDPLVSPHCRGPCVHRIG